MEHLVDIFKSACSRFPDRIALKDCNRSYTYHEVYHRSLKISEFLIQNNIKPGDRIVCITKKNTESILCFWGILLSGAVAVLLDHQDTINSNAPKLKQASPKAVIFDKNEIRTVPGIDPATMLFDFSDLLSGTFFTEPAVSNSPVLYPPICYILFTSGTLGLPKAVQISQTNIIHYTLSIYERIGCPDNVKAAHVSTFAADLGLTSLLIALISGGTLRIFNKEESTDPVLFNAVINREKISLLKITPSHFLSLTSEILHPFKQPIGYLILGGEKLQWTVVKNIFDAALCLQLYNHYGPTETTVGAMVYKVERTSAHFDITASVPIGKPLGKGSCIINGEGQEPFGELCIAGPGVSPGYYNNPAENEKRFFVMGKNREDESCYRTGDICKLLADGNFEFLYRSDRQVKVRGYRIELGEIELALASHPDIENAAVIASTVNEHSILEAFIKPAEGKELDEKKLRAWLLELLPAFKIPSALYFYTKTPLNSNGKVDLDGLLRFFKNGSLKNPPGINGESSWLMAVTDNWKAILNKGNLSDSDHFFETGGDSLLAIQLVGKLQRLGYRISINSLNNHPVFSDFVSLNPEKQINDKALMPDHHHEQFTVSQDLFLKQQDFNHDYYCQTILLETTDQISIREMTLAINGVLQSHLQLSSAFRASRETGASSSGMALGTLILDKNKSIAGQIQNISNKLLHEISLEKGKLFAAHIFIDPSGKDYLYLACHHIAVDVISWNIIIDEIRDYYTQLLEGHTPQLTVENTVNDFFKAAGPPEIKISSSDQMTQPLWKLPPLTDDEAGIASPHVYTLVLPPDISALLQKQDELKNTSTVAGFLLDAFGTCILEEFNLPGITIDVEFHGRPRDEALPDLSRSVSWWAVTLPVNIEQGRLGSEHCSDLLKIKSEEAGKLNLMNGHTRRKRSHRPDLRFNYLGHFPEQFGNAGLGLKPSALNAGSTRSRKAQQEYDLLFTARFIGVPLIIDIQYSPARFKESVIADLARCFFTSLKQSLLKENFHKSASQLVTLKSIIPSVGQPLYTLNAGTAQENRSAKTFLITGATGFLGSYLLREMISNEQVIVYCLVRAKNQELAEKRLADSIRDYFGELPETCLNRIHAIKGDLRNDNLGIALPEYKKLADQVDLIIHAAADINLTKPYNDLYKTNVQALADIIKLASLGKNKELHYVSTLAVAGFDPSGSYRSFSEGDFEYGQQFISDYERTKFEAEKIVREFYNKQGRGKIYRAGHISADSISSKFQKNIGENRIFQMIKGMVLLKQIPDRFNERVSFSYVDVIAAGIANSCLGRYPDEMMCMHLDNPDYISFGQIVDMINLMGCNIRTVSIETFRKSVREYEGKPEDKKAVDLMSIWVQRFIDSPRNVNFISANSLDMLAQSGVYFQKTSLAWMKNVISEAVKVQFLHVPGILEESIVFGSD